MLLSLLPRGLLLPPVSLLLAALMCWLLGRRHPRLAWRMMGVCLLGLLVLAMPITPALLFAGLESGMAMVRPPTNTPSAASSGMPGAIVILGGDTAYGQPGAAILSGAIVGGLSLERLRAGAALYREVQLPILITGGLFRAHTMSLADLMAGTLRRDFATPTRWVEPRSADTWENAQFSAEILTREHIGAVYVVTHPWHMRRAIMAFAHFGITVWPAPTSLDALPDLVATDFMPNPEAWMDSYYALHEWVGCAVYALRG